MRAFLIMIVLLFFSACDSDTVAKTRELNRNNPKLQAVYTTPQKTQSNRAINNETPKERMLKIDYKNKLALQELQKKSQKELATINAQKEVHLKKLEVEKAKTLHIEKTKQVAIEANKSLELAQIKQKSEIIEKEQEISLYKIIAFLLLFLLLVWLILRYINQHAKRKHEAYLKEQEYNFEAFKQESAMKHQNISKMLEIIGDEKSDPAIKKEITKILSHNKGSLIEHKKR